MIRVKKWMIPMIWMGAIGLLLVEGISQKAIGCPSPSRSTKSEPIATPDDPSNPIWTVQRVAIVRKSTLPLPCASAQLTLVSVMDKVFNLPEVKQQAGALTRSPRGNAEVIAVLLKPEPREQLAYYTIQVFAQYPDQRIPLWLLRVNQWTGAIDIQDNGTGSYIPLEQWRQQH